MYCGHRTKEVLFFIIICVMQMNEVFPIKTIFSGSLSTSGPALFEYDSALQYKYFQAYLLTVNSSGYYTFTSNSSLDTYGYLYINSFDPAQMNSNLILEDDDSGVSNQFHLNQYCASSTQYILVVTTFKQKSIGSFFITIDGPILMNYLVFAPAMPPVVKPSLTNPSPDRTFSFSGQLTDRSATFSAPHWSGQVYYYQAYRILPHTSGNYSFSSQSSIDTLAYLYEDAYYSSSPTSNLIAFNDEDGGDGQFLIRNQLNATRFYFLLVTTYLQRITGNFTVRGTGPSFPTIIDYQSNSVLITSTVASGTSDLTSSYFGSLVSTSRFARPFGNGSYYYYQALQILVNQAGSYSMTTSSSIDTYGCLYNNAFDPSYSNMDLIVCDDDDGAANEFLITSNLLSGRYYTLVITTYAPATIGFYTAQITGPSRVNIIHYIASTSRPIETSTTVLSNQTFSFSGSLTSMSLTFVPPHAPVDLHYYQAYKIDVQRSGEYVFVSDSFIQMYAYLYEGAYYSFEPSRNLKANNDSVDASNQFFLQTNLYSTRLYFLIVTTYLPQITGNFLVTVSGPPDMTVVSHAPPSTALTNSMYSNYLLSSQRFARPSGSGSYYYYEALRIQVETSGSYSMTTSSTIDTYGCLYGGVFNPSYPTLDLITCDDNGGADGQFLANGNLVSGGYYILVVTTSAAKTNGFFTVQINGRSQVRITSFQSPTTGPLQTTTAAFLYPIFQFSGTLSTRSSTFLSPYRPKDVYYSQAFRIVVYSSGFYTFLSDSTVDTSVYVYQDPYYPLIPTLNLIAWDDDSGGGQFQFLLRIYLNTNQTYSLIVTTYQARTTGSFTVKGDGPSTPSATAYTPASGEIKSIYSSYLSSSQRFARPSGNSSYYYYEALRIHINVSGSYSMTTSSNIDTYGCLYDGSFDPSYPTLYSVVCNNDGGAVYQFFITSNLVSARYYTLVVTTFAAKIQGFFTAQVTGPYPVDIVSYQPLAARPIQTTTSSSSDDIKKRKTLSVGAIAGIVIGAVAFIIIVGIVIKCFIV